MSQKSLYKYLVSKLLENRLHLYKNIDLYFSSMGSVVRQAGMQQAVDAAILAYNEKNRPCIRLGCFRNAWHDAHFHLNRTYLHIIYYVK